MVRAVGAAIAVWPTKLAFAPAAAGEALRILRESGVTPSGVPAFSGNAAARADALPIAPLPWHDDALPWT